MASTQQYDIFFVNQGTSGGLVCLYQDPANAVCNDANVQTLAWMVCGAEPGVHIDFQWQRAYDFAWFNDASPATQEIVDAGVGAVTFSLEQYGYHFQEGTPPSTGALSIHAAASIPSANDALVGLGMSGTGTFACPALPNMNYMFTPVVNAELVYWLAFGGDFALNMPVDPATLPYQPLRFSFPVGVYAMTVTLTPDNTLALTRGAPVSDATAVNGRSRATIVFRRGQAY